MTIEIKVPAMGECVTEATVARWFKKEGDAVERDEPLLELETDKVTVEVPAPADGAHRIHFRARPAPRCRSAPCWAPSPKAKPGSRRATRGRATRCRRAEDRSAQAPQACRSSRLQPAAAAGRTRR